MHAASTCTMDTQWVGQTGDVASLNNQVHFLNNLL